MEIKDILHNRHFCQFAAILSMCMSPQWRMRHPEVPSVRSDLDALSRLIRGGHGLPPNIKRMLLTKWTTMFLNIVGADPRLCYAQDDMQWFIELLEVDGNTAVMVLSMLFAVACAQRKFVDAEQLATTTGKAASTWRNKAAAGEIIGAFKAGGKTWMFPVIALRAIGVDAGIEPIEVDV